MTQAVTSSRSLTTCALFLVAASASASDRTFSESVEVEVPAKGLFGAPPDRTRTIEFDLPEGFEVVRGPGEVGVTVDGVNFGGLTEKKRRLDRTARGVKLTWTLENRRSTPVTGRKATLTLHLIGRRTARMGLSEKYKAFRRRLLTTYVHAGRVAEWHDPTVTPGAAGGCRLKFADGTIYLGFGLTAFATEDAILRDAGGDAADTRRVLAALLDAADELDLAANRKFGAAVPGVPNGMLARDDVAAADPRVPVRFHPVCSDWQSPREDASPSGDQIFGLMSGLLCVEAFCGDDALRARARGLAARLYEYARRTDFVLTLPNGTPTARGADVRWLSSLLHGVQNRVTGADRWDDSRIDTLLGRSSLNGVGAFWDAPSTPKLTARLTGRELRVPAVSDRPVELNSFALHIILTAIAAQDGVWSQDELESAAVKANHHQAVLLRCALTGGLPKSFDEVGMNQILAACPAAGPSQSLPASTGWQHDNRWVRCTNVFEPRPGLHEYNGLDWMVLYNLGQIVYRGGPR